MIDHQRLRELESYQIMDTAPEEELNELAEIASVICDTPISLLSLLDEKRQWFKARKGLNVLETPIEDAFCQHALHNPQEVLVVEDSYQDDRFRNNPLVLGKPYIRFYAGAPLETPNGLVLGTLCVIDDKPRKLSENQKRALQLLAKKAMGYLNTRKQLLHQEGQIENNAAKLKKLTDQAPGAIYQFTMNAEGEMSFPFISKGIEDIHPELDAEKIKTEPQYAFKAIHPEDLQEVQESIQESFENLSIWNKEYRVVSSNGDISWHWAHAKPEKMPDGSVTWYGSFQDMTQKKEYTRALEQILFDISHVMRKPVSTLMGLTNAIEVAEPDEKMLRDFMQHIQTTTKELDDYIRQLNNQYSAIKNRINSSGTKQ